MKPEEFFLLIKLGDRNAIPVRAIPYATAWAVAPYDVASHLAGHSKSKPSISRNVVAYQLQAGSFAEVKIESWKEIFSRFESADEAVPEGGGQALWRNRALSKLPPGVFIWADDFFACENEKEKESVRRFEPGDEVQDISVFSKGGLTCIASLSDQELAVLFEKFGTHDLPPRRSDDVKELLPLLLDDIDKRIGYRKEVFQNGTAIDWQYWVRTCPTLTSVEAACLMNGLNPNRFKNLSDLPLDAEPVETLELCKNIERLANRTNMVSASPREWLEWAETHNLVVHNNFRFAICEAYEKQNRAENLNTFESPKGLTKAQIITVFSGIHFNSEQWNNYLADQPKWIKQAQVQVGSRDRKHIGLWDPVAMAISLLDFKVPIKKIDAAFVAHSKILADWVDMWSEKSDLFR